MSRNEDVKRLQKFFDRVVNHLANGSAIEDAVTVGETDDARKALARLAPAPCITEEEYQAVKVAHDCIYSEPELSPAAARLRDLLSRGPCEHAERIERALKKCEAALAEDAALPEEDRNGGFDARAKLAESVNSILDGKGGAA